MNVNARLPPALVEAVDAHAVKLSRDGARITRSDAFRILVRKGLGRAAPPQPADVPTPQPEATTTHPQAGSLRRLGDALLNAPIAPAPDYVQKKGAP